MTIAAIAFVAVIAISAVSIADESDASPTIEYDGLYYELFYDDDHAEVCEPYLGTYSGDIEIAATIEYGGHTLAVTVIKSNAFRGCTGLTSVDLKNVTSIGSSAFSGCTGLTSVDLKNVTSIGYQSFDGCTSLTEFKVNSSNTEYSVVDKILFNKDCTTLVQCPLGFSGEVILPDTVVSISDYAFYCCTGLTSVDLKNVTSIGNNTFYKCTGLTEFKVNSSNTEYSVVDKVLFNKDCTTLLQYPSKLSGAYTLPDAVLSIGSMAFYGCTGLSSVDLKNVTSIGYQSFDGCTGLISVDLKNVTSIDNSTFDGCTSLTEFKVDGGNTAYSVVDKVLFTKDGTKLIKYPAGLSGEYTLPDAVLSIGGMAFSGCTGLSSVDLKNVTSIGSSAFSGCTGLSSVDLKNVTALDDGVFYGCTSLTEFKVDGGNTAYSVVDKVLFNKDCTTLVQYPMGLSGEYTMPDTVLSIGSMAFYGCTGLTSVDLRNVTSIGNGAFNGCTGLSSVDLRNVTSISYYAFRDCTGLSSVDLKNVTSISSDSFSGCTSLTEFKVNSDNTAYSVVDKVLFTKDGTTLVQYPRGLSGKYVLPDTVLSISNYAVYGCTGLTSVDLKNVTSIGSFAFCGCTGLTSVDLKNVTSIGNGAFNGCTGLLTLSLPEIPPTLSGYIFRGCPSNTVMSVESSITAYRASDSWQPYMNNIVIGWNIGAATKTDVFAEYNETTKTLTISGTGNMKDWTVQSCSPWVEDESIRKELTTVVISEGVTNVGSYAFSSCSAVTSVTIPNSVIAIGAYAFTNTKITSVDVSAYVTSIGSQAFATMTLTSVNVSEDNNNFSDVDGVLFNKDKTKIIMYPAGKEGVSYSIPGTVIAIGENAFCNAPFTSVTIPEDVTTIETLAFIGSHLTSVVIPSKVTSIGDRAFIWNQDLSEVTVQNNTAPALGVYVFEMCAEDIIIYVPAESVESYRNAAGWSNYAGKIFADLTLCTVDDIADQTYTGSAIEPNVIVKDGATTLVKDTDYTVTYSDNVNAGTANVTVTGIGSYLGIKAVTFTIVPKVITSSMVPDVDDQTYTGKEIKPVVVKHGDRILVEGTDYTIVYNGDVVNTGGVIYEITGKGNYDSTATYGSMYEIVKAAPSKEFFDYKAPSDLSYDGKEKFATVTLKEGITGTGEYVVTYSDNINVGTCVVTVAVEGGSNMEAGTFEIGTFVINEDNKYIAGATVCIVLVVAFVVLIGLACFMYRPKKQ